MRLARAQQLACLWCKCTPLFLRRAPPRRRQIGTQSAQQVLPLHIERSTADEPKEEGERGLGIIPPECIALVYPSVMSIGALQLGLTNAASLALLSFPLLLFQIITPTVDLLIGPTTTHKTTQPVRPMGPGSPAYFFSRIMPVFYILLHIIASLMSYWASSTASSAITGCPWVLLVLVASMGMCATVGKGAGHELVHSRNSVHRAVGNLYFLWTWHGAYTRSHHHHHRYVGTPLDHSSARKGELFLHFLPRYILGTWTIAWRDEVQEARGRWKQEQRRARHLDKLGTDQAAKGSHSQQQNEMMGTGSTAVDAGAEVLPTASHSSEQAPLVASIPWGQVTGIAAQMGITGIVYLLFGPAAVQIHLGAAFLSLTMQSLADYALHYGLKRNQLPDGRYEPVTPYLSFNSGFKWENTTMHTVLYHSDHHMSAAKPYKDLGLTFKAPKPASGSSSASVTSTGSEKPHEGERPIRQAPVLLPNLPFIIILPVALLCPPLWFRMVDPLVEIANRNQRMYAQEVLAAAAR